MHLFSEIKSKYGREAVKVVRDFEAGAKKISRFRNHLVLSLRCKQIGIRPPSLKLRCPVISKRTKTVIRNNEQCLLNERIRVINGKLIALRAHYSRAANSVKCVLREDLAEAVFTHMNNIQETEFKKTKDRHKKKFERLFGSEEEARGLNQRSHHR